MKKLVVLAAVAAGVYFAVNKMRQQQASQDLWAEATDSVDSDERR